MTFSSGQFRRECLIADKRLRHIVGVIEQKQVFVGQEHQVLNLFVIEIVEIFLSIETTSKSDTIFFLGLKLTFAAQYM